MSDPVLKKIILEVVDNQLRDSKPPETRRTLKRLIKVGYSRQQAREMIGSVVAAELWYVMHENQVFDEQRFVDGLNQLE